MNSFLHRRVEHPFRWIGFSLVIVIGLTLALLWGALFQRRMVPIEQVLWTSSPDYKVFFGPGTKPSSSLATSLHELRTKGYLTNDLLVPDVPFLITHSLSSPSSGGDEPVMIAPFTEDVGLQLRREFRMHDTRSEP